MDSATTVRVGTIERASWLSVFWSGLKRRRSPCFVRSCRLVVEDADHLSIYRVIYCSTESDYVQAESMAESTIADQLAGGLIRGRVIEQQWKRGRIVTTRTASTESDAVQTLIRQLRASPSLALLRIEAVRQGATTQTNCSAAAAYESSM